MEALIIKINETKMPFCNSIEEFNDDQAPSIGANQTYF